jgi:nucleoside-diphosphate-sugar epimerase
VARAAGARAVLYAVNPVYTRWPQDALPFARAGMRIAEELGATFLMPGNVCNFGKDMPELLRESTPQRPSTRKGRIRVAMEAELEARAAQGLRSVVLRAGDFFGAGEGTWLDLAIAKSLGAGRLVYPGPLGLPHAWAYLPDLARAVVALAERDGLPAFARFHSPGHTLTGTRLLRGIAHAARAAGLAPAAAQARGREAADLS